MTHTFVATPAIITRLLHGLCWLSGDSHRLVREECSFANGGIGVAVNDT